MRARRRVTKPIDNIFYYRVPEDLPQPPFLVEYPPSDDAHLPRCPHESRPVMAGTCPLSAMELPRGELPSGLGRLWTWSVFVILRPREPKSPSRMRSARQRRGQHPQGRDPPPRGEVSSRGGARAWPAAEAATPKPRRPLLPSQRAGRHPGSRTRWPHRRGPTLASQDIGPGEHCRKPGDPAPQASPAARPADIDARPRKRLAS